MPISEGKSVMKWEDGRTRDLLDVAGEVKYREASGGPHELFNLEDTQIPFGAGGDQGGRQSKLTAQARQQEQAGGRAMRKSHLAIAALAIAALGAHPVAAQTYPSKPISIVIPLGAGGAMDSITRTIAEQLSQRLGQPVVIENKPGGGMVIGSNAVAQAEPDGHTLMNAPSGAYVINPTLYKKLPYDPQKDFVPVALYARIPFVLVVNPSLPVKSVKELIQYSKDNPGKLSYAASTIGARHPSRPARCSSTTPGSTW